MMTDKHAVTNHPVGSALAFQSKPPMAAIMADDATVLIDAARDSVEYHESGDYAYQEDDEADKATRVENSLAHVLEIIPKGAESNG